MTYASDEIGALTGQPVELYKFWIRGGTTEWFFTTAAYNITYSGDEYVATSGLERKEIDESNDALKSELKIIMPSSHSFPQQWLIYPPSGIVDVVLYRGHGANFVQYWRGVIEHVNPFERGSALVLCGPLTDALRVSFRSRTYDRLCGASLYDSNCGVDKTAYKISGSVTTVSGKTVTSSLFTGYADDYFNGGYFVSHGSSRRIKDHDGSAGTITLYATINGLAAGSAFEAYPGCDHTAATCKTKFNNVINFRGFPYIPDQEPITQNILKAGV